MYLILISSYIVLAEPGDRVEADEAIAQIETDKVSNNYLLYSLPCSSFLPCTCLIFFMILV